MNKTERTSKSENPYASELNTWINERHESDFPKQGERESNVRGIAQNSVYRAWGLTHPLSQLKDPGLIAWHTEKLIEEADYLLALSEFYKGRFIPGGAWNVERFVLRHLLDAFYRLKSNDLLPDKMNEWLTRARLSVEWQYNNYWNGPGQVYLPGWNNTAGYYPNSDAMYILVMGLAGKLYEDQRYLKRAHEFVGHLDNCMLPDGGFYYKFNDNEIPTYHSLNIQCLARYALVTGDDYALDVIRRSVEYYPLSFGTTGVTEKTGYPWFKRQMGEGISSSTADIVAFVAKDGRNKYLAEKFARPSADINAVDFWSSEILPVKPEGNYICKDRNMNGIRGRFADFSWVTTFGHGAPMEAFIGAIMAPSNEKSTTKYSAFELITPEIQIDGREGKHMLTHASVSDGTFYRDMIHQDDFAAIALTYQLHMPWREFLKGEPVEKISVPWMSHQVWFANKERIIGLVITECIKDTEANYTRARIRFTPHGAIKKLTESEFVINNLRLNLHSNTYPQASITDAAQTTYDSFSISRLGSELVLTENSGKYRNKDSFKVALELHPDYELPVSGFSELGYDGLKGFKLDHRNEQLVIAFNPNPVPIDFEYAFRGKFQAYNGKEKFLPEPDHEKISITIEPYKLLIINSQSE